jgi:hypothetical protein
MTPPRPTARSLPPALAAALFFVSCTPPHPSTTAPPGPPQPRVSSTPPPDAQKPPEDPLPAVDLSLDALNQRWAELLAASVNRQGLVDYLAMAQGSEKLKEFVAGLAPTRVFENDRQKLAFLINGYNGCVVYNVLKRHAKSVGREVGFFDRDLFTLLGKRTTLDDLRDKLIRPMNDPRAHMALVAAAVGSPPMRPEPYLGEKLDAQLDDQSRRVMASRRLTAVVGRTLFVPALFQKFAADFKAMPYGDAPGFIRKYSSANPAFVKVFQEEPTPLVEYQAFNWALNSSADE